MNDILYIVDNSSLMINYKKDLDRYLYNVKNIIYMDNEFNFSNYYKVIKNIENVSNINLCISNFPTDDFGLLNVDKFYKYLIESKINFNLILFMDREIMNFYYKLYNYRDVINKNRKIRYFVYAYMAFI